jgi:hypothetical protein
MTEKPTPAQKVMNAYNQRALATKRSTAIIGVLQEIVNQLDRIERFKESEKLEKLCHQLGVNECRAHIFNIIIELFDSND